MEIEQGKNRSKETSFSFYGQFDNEEGQYSIANNKAYRDVMIKVKSDAHIEYVRGFLHACTDKYKLYQDTGFKSRFIDLILANCEGYGMAEMLVNEFGACPGIRDTDNDNSAIDYATDDNYRNYLKDLADEQEKKFGYFKKSRQNRDRIIYGGPKTEFIEN